MSAGTLPQSDGLSAVLSGCRRQLLTHTLLRGSAVLVATLTTVTLLACTLDYLFALNPTVRTILLGIAVAACVQVAWTCLIRPLWLVVPDEELSAAVDLSCPELQESLATLVSIQQPTATASEAGSVVMRRHLQQEVWSGLRHAESVAVVDSQQTLKRWGLAAGLLLVVLLPLIFWPSGSKLLAQRFLLPWENWSTATNLYFQVPDGNRTVARGSDVTLAAVPAWRNDSAGPRPQDVRLIMTAENGREEQLPMPFDERAGEFVVTLDRIQEGFQYHIEGGDAASEVFTLQVVDAPRIQAAMLTATPPVYVGRAIESFDGIVGEMQVFDGSRLELLLQFSKPVVQADLVWLRRDPVPDSETVLEDRRFANATGQDQAPPPPGPLAEQISGQLTADGKTAVFEFTADVGGEFAFDVVDEFRVHNQNEPDRSLTVIYDSPPELQVSGIRNDDSFRPDDIVPLDCTVIDDIGVGNLELHYQRNDQAIRIDSPQDLDRGAPQVQHAFRLNLGSLDVVTGDVVSLRVRAADERPDPRPHEVWSQTWTIRIDDQASAVGAEALNEDVRRIVEQLRELEQQLQQDTEEAYRLKNEAGAEWTDQDREQTSQLSEKQQQQGRQLQQLANEVATHPLMQKPAEALQQIGQQVREQVPAELNQAAAADREAQPRLQDAARQIDAAKRDLGEVIQDIEQIGQLEKELAELNRLALEAEQLAGDADQLNQDRQRPDEDLPPDTEPEEWQDQLDQRQQQLNQDRQQLDTDVSDLLQRQQELLKSAQRSQQEQLAGLAEQARELARQQQQLANNVNQEARETGRAARNVANQLQQARDDVRQLSEQLQQTPAAAAAVNPEPLDQALKELRQGNLAEPRQAVQQTQQQLQQAAQQLQQPAAGQQAEDDPAANADRNQQLADQSQQLAQQLQSIDDQLQHLQQERNAGPARTPDPAATAEDSAAPPVTEQSDPNQSAAATASAETMPNQAAASDNSEPAAAPSQQTTPSAVQDLLQRSAELTQAAQEISNNLSNSESAGKAAVSKSEAAANHGQQATEAAQNGQFSKAAEQMRKASNQSDQAAGQLSDPQQQDRRDQLQGLSRQFAQLAEAAQMLQPDSSARVAAQQQAQQQLAQQIGELPQQLTELTQKLDLPALQMQQQARQAQAGQQAAEQATESSSDAADGLQQGSFQQAAESGQDAAAQLNQLAQLAGQAAGDPQENESLVPADVGESVAQALQNLQQAAQAMQPESTQMADSSEAGEPAGQDQNTEAGQSGQLSSEDAAAADQQPGEASDQAAADSQPGQQAGEQQPGQNAEPGQNPGSQSLNQAAKSLAQAAKNSLPNQFTPGQVTDSDAQAQAQQAFGNDSAWDGRSPFAAGAAIGDRDWGGLNEALDTEVLSGRGESLDSEYSSLIRMYFRELAKASAENKPPTP